MLEALPGHISHLLPLQGEMWQSVIGQKLLSQLQALVVAHELE